MEKLTRKSIAELVGCAPSTVSRVLSGKRSKNTPIGRKILRAHEKMKDSQLRTLEEIKKSVG